MITADLVRRIIVDHDAARPRSQQTAIGPSDLSTACDRRIGYQMLGVPPMVPDAVNLAAWVGTGIHAQMESALAHSVDWVTEVECSVPVADTVVGCHVDAYHYPTMSVIDWKGCGPSALKKYRKRTPDNYRSQIAWYGMAMALAGHEVRYTGICYIPRQGELRDIHMDIWEFDQAEAERQIRRYESLLTLVTAGPAVLPLLPVVHDCKFCQWWSPASDNLTIGCPGQPPTGTTPDLPPWESEAEAKAEAQTEGAVA